MTTAELPLHENNLTALQIEAQEFKVGFETAGLLTEPISEEIKTTREAVAADWKAAETFVTDAASFKKLHRTYDANKAEKVEHTFVIAEQMEEVISTEQEQISTMRSLDAHLDHLRADLATLYATIAITEDQIPAADEAVRACNRMLARFLANVKAASIKHTSPDRSDDDTTKFIQLTDTLKVVERDARAAAEKAGGLVVEKEGAEEEVIKKKEAIAELKSEYQKQLIEVQRIAERKRSIVAVYERALSELNSYTFEVFMREYGHGGMPTVDLLKPVVQQAIASATAETTELPVLPELDSSEIQSDMTQVIPATQPDAQTTETTVMRAAQLGDVELIHPLTPELLAQMDAKRATVDPMAAAETTVFDIAQEPTDDPTEEVEQVGHEESQPNDLARLLDFRHEDGGIVVRASTRLAM